MRIYGAITKIEPQDDGTLKVVGVASSGAVDEADEQVTPAAMKAALPAYMRFGALREMHGLSAAGATLRAEVDEAGVTRIEAHVVDPLAVKKVRLGVYKGFSIGGKVLQRDPGDRKTITALKLDEISLVDRPCNPEAVIEMWKADAAIPPPGPSNAEVIAKAIELAEAAGKRGRHTDFVVAAREALLKAPAEPASNVLPPACERAAKLGARNSAADLDRIQAAHDELVALGAQCRPGQPDEDEDDGLDDSVDKADRSADGAQDISEQLDGLRRTVAALQKRLEEVSAEPRPPRTAAGWARAVSKAEDSSPAGPAISAEDLRKFLDGLSQEERGRLELRAALSRPMPFHGR